MLENHRHLRVDRKNKLDFYEQISPIDSHATKVASTLGKDFSLIFNTLKQLGVSHELWLLDFGSGKGYALYQFSKYFSHVAGVELSQEANAVAKENLTKLGIQNVEIYHKNAKAFTEIDKFCVFYFFNPFDEVIMSAVLDNILFSIERVPRTVFLIYNNPYCAFLFEEKGFVLKASFERLFPCHFYVNQQKSSN